MTERIEYDFLGYRVGTGNIVGLPGQGTEELCRDLLFLQDFQADMVSIGLFLPQKDTPAAEYPAGRPGVGAKNFRPGADRLTPGSYAGNHCHGDGRS